ncbi:MAG: hypothetical protein QY326_02205 [Bdellovibrionota bacterium]|nr:MAG: hypothetical protein QY326_02205 [Bdellovibrionota bacterium]
MTAEAKGASQEEARQGTLKLLEASQARALESCRSKHENLSGCVAAKMSSNTTLMNSLGFAAKKALQDAIVEDCKHQSGACSLVKIEDPKCSVIETAPIKTEAEGKAESKKGEKKK